MIRFAMVTVAALVGFAALDPGHEEGVTVPR